MPADNTPNNNGTSKDKNISDTSEPQLYKFIDLDVIFQRLVLNKTVTIIPLKPGTKEPFSTWKSYQSNAYPIEKLQQHRGNFGILTGGHQEWGNLVVLDIDDNKGSDGLYKHFNHLDTLQIKTAKKGFHIYFWSKESVKDTNYIRRLFNLEVELRGDSKKYVVLPPSSIIYGDGTKGKHELIKTGKKYPIMDVEEPVEFVRDILIKAGYKEQQGVEATDISSDDVWELKNRTKIGGNWERNLFPNEIDDLIELLEPLYKEGQRHHMALYLSGWMFKAEISFESALMVIKGLSKRDDEQKDRILAIKNSYRGLGKGIKGISGIEELIDAHHSGIPKKERRRYVYDDLKKLRDIIEHPGCLLRVHRYLSIIREGGKGITGAIKQVHQFLRIRYDIVKDSVSGELAIYNQKKGYYEFLDDNQFQELLSTIFEDEIFTKDETKKLKSIFAKMKEPTDSHIVFQNGLLNLETLKLEEFTPDYVLTFKVPYEWKPEAKGSYVKEKLEEILIDSSGEEKGDKNKYNNYLELVGYVLCEPGNPRQKIFLYIGRSGSGKTQLINLIAGLIKGGVSSVPLQQFNETFGLQPLIGKKVNTLYDISQEEISDPSVIKAVSGNDSITINRKYKDPITFENGLPVKTIGSGNIPPKINDDSQAMARRFNISELNNDFSDNPIENLSEKLLEDEEGMEWLIHTSVTKYNEIKAENRKFTLDLSTQEMQMEYLKQSDPCRYAMECLYEFSNDENDFYTSEELIMSINKFLELEGLRIPTDTRTNHHPAIRMTGGVYTMKRINNYPTRGYTLIKAKNEDNDPIKNRLDTKTLIDLNTPRTLDLEFTSDTEKQVTNLFDGKGPYNLSGIISDAKELYNIEIKDTMAILKKWRDICALIIDNTAYYDYE